MLVSNGKRSPELTRAALDRLSAREVQTLQLLAQGLEYKAIADSLNIGFHRVNELTKGIYRKLGVHSRAQAVSVALSVGLFIP